MQELDMVRVKSTPISSVHRIIEPGEHVHVFVDTCHTHLPSIVASIVLVVLGFDCLPGEV